MEIPELLNRISHPLLGKVVGSSEDFIDRADDIEALK